MSIFGLIRKVKENGLAREPRGPASHAYLVIAEYLIRETPPGTYSIDEVLLDLDTLIAAAAKAKEELLAAKAEADKS